MFALVAVVPGTALRASPGSLSYAISHWEMKDGLPLNKVRALAQTPDGYLWIGTFNGLARFDGVRFKAFDVSNTPELSHNAIASLCVDTAGRLWIADNAGGITVLDGGRFRAVALPPEWPAKPVVRLVAGGGGGVWALNGGALFALRESGAHQFIPVRAHPNLFTVDSAGRAWLATGGQLHRVQETTGMEPVAAAHLNGRSQALFPSPRGGVWILHDDWLRRWHDGAWVEDRGRADWGTILLATFLETQSGKIVGGSFKEGVRILNPDGTLERLDERNGLAHNWAYCLFEDVEGTIWVGTGNGGLQGLHSRRVTMVDSPDHWRSSAVLSVAPSSAGGLWIGTEGGGVYRLRDGSVSVLPGREDMWQAVANSVLEDRRGRLWVGTWSSSLRYLEDQELKPAYHVDDGRNVVLTVFETRAGDLWVGTRNGPGRLRGGVWEWFEKHPILSSATVRCFAETSDGAIWCGSDGNGIFRIGATDATQYRAADGLAGDHVRTIYADGDDTLWIGTRSGLSRFTAGKFATFTTQHGLPSDVICQILDAGDGDFWIGSLGGIFRVARADLNRCANGDASTVNCLVCDEWSGLATLEMSEQGQPSGCRTEDGRLWFATGKGLAMIVPSRVAENPLPPPVCLEEVLVDGRVLTAGAAAALTVGPGARQVEFRYTGLSFSNPGRVGFRYRLEGLHNDWLDAGARRSTVYTQLAPGNYVFRVTARNADGIWNETGAALGVRVLPYFWQTWWFKTGSWMGSLAGVGVGVLLVARRKARRRLEALDRQRDLERERGRIARDIHDDLGSNLTRIVMLSESARAALINQQETAAELAEICQTGRDLTLQLGEIVWAINPEHDTLDSFANYAGSYARGFLARAGLRCRLDVPVTLPPWPLDSPTRHNLFLALKEVLNNVVKHAAASSVFIMLRLEGDTLCFAVEDDGRGFAPGAGSSGGNGLVNLARRLADIGGRCEIDHPANSGTRVRFTVTLSRRTTSRHANL